ncbi:MAG: hypothetical protein GY792_13025 [Gammaproteobacteria bacterium]|nr:hypothetical protein [Gammaproteobacteria bacterium]
MPAVLTHKAIMLLARERVQRIQSVLQAKINAGGANVSTLDRQLLAIATETSRVFASEPRPRTQLPGILFAQPVGADLDSYPISQYAVLGSMGPDLTAFSHLLAPGQNWVFDNVHKGTPDPDRELVNAQTSDFVMQLWSKAHEQITNAMPDPADRARRDARLDKMRAYVLGHLCHVAADVVSHPYVNDAEWQEPSQGEKKSHAEVEGEMDALVARTLLRRDSTRSGQDWDVWWPSENLPDQFFSAYADALEAVYKAQSRRRTGYGEFEEHLADLGAETLDVDFIKDGYNMLRHGIVGKGYSYGYGSWWGWLTLLAVPMIALPLVVAALPKGGNIFLKDQSKRTERAWMEFLSTPMFFALPATIGYGALVGSLSTGGVEGRYWLGMVGAIIAAICGIILLSTLGVNELHPGFSWPVLFAIPAIFSAIQTVLALVACGRDDRGGRMAIGLVFGLPFILLLAFFLFFGIFPGLVAPDGDAGTPFESEGFWIAYAIWAAACLVGWFWLPLIIRDKRIPENPAGDIVKPRFVRMFDEGTLHHDRELENRDVPAEVFPSGRRKLVKLWWEGSGDLYIRSDRYQLQFSASEDGSDPRIVPAPIAPMTLTEYMTYLSSTVVQPGGADTDKLKWEMCYPDDVDYELPAGAVFGDHGDRTPDKFCVYEETVDHDAEAVKFKKLDTSADGSDYYLYHAYKVAQSVRYGEKGAVPPERNLGGANPISNVEEEEGYNYIHNPQAAQATETLMSYAGDFGAILSMAATTHMTTNLQDSQNNNVSKVYQVFRNWNLDRRRVNEWRTLVAGEALSEKGSTRSGYDSKMLGATLRPANHATWQEALLGSSQAAFDEGEQTARQLGWVKALREWMDVSNEAGQNTLDGASAFKPGNPTNRALSRAMAYLFDLADPTAAP